MALAHRERSIVSLGPMSRRCSVIVEDVHDDPQRSFWFGWVDARSSGSKDQIVSLPRNPPLEEAASGSTPLSPGLTRVGGGRRSFDDPLSLLVDRFDRYLLLLLLLLLSLSVVGRRRSSSSSAAATGRERRSHPRAVVLACGGERARVEVSEVVVFRFDLEIGETGLTRGQATQRSTIPAQSGESGFGTLHPLSRPEVREPPYRPDRRGGVAATQRWRAAVQMLTLGHRSSEFDYTLIVNTRNFLLTVYNCIITHKLFHR
jgi:hypothetical protein